MTDTIKRWPDPIAASSWKLDHELAHHIAALAAEENRSYAGTRCLAPALIATAAWAGVAMTAWLVVAWLL